MSIEDRLRQLEQTITAATGACRCQAGREILWGDVGAHTYTCGACGGVVDERAAWHELAAAPLPPGAKPSAPKEQNF